MSRNDALDVLVIGGGIAGLWCAASLHAHGHAVALAERARLGDGQTLDAQGILHGGLKFSLGGRQPAAGAIAALPDRWRTHLRGRLLPDLSGTRVLADRVLLWTRPGLTAALARLAGSTALRGRMVAAPGSDRGLLGSLAPEAPVFALHDLVIDTQSLVTTLAGHLAGRLLRLDPTAQPCVRRDGLWHLETAAGTLRARWLLLTAGAANVELLEHLGRPPAAMRLRPLHQVTVDLALPEPLFGHYLGTAGALEPNLTLTSHAVAPGRLRWYLGGALAGERGVARSESEQIDAARALLASALPRLDLDGAHFRTWRAQRAEPARRRRDPDQSHLHADDGVMVAWPTKLTLAPVLGDRVLATLQQAGCPRSAEAAEPLPSALAAPEPGHPRWLLQP